MNRKSKTEGVIELRPDGWARFETAVGAAVKSGPKHRVVGPAGKKSKKASKTSRR